MAPHPASLTSERLLAECDERRLRRGGPGGQHRNKVETAVELTHKASGVAAEANEKRSQQKNREVATFRLRVRLALAIRTERVPKPSEMWASRTKAGKLAINPSHEDFPTLLAEALDHLVMNDWETSATAKQLGVSTSQLVKLLKHEPAALKLLNDQRNERGLKPLN